MYHYFFFNIGARGGGAGGHSNFAAALTPGYKPIPLVQEAGWASVPVRTGEKSRLHRHSIPGLSSL